MKRFERIISVALLVLSIALLAGVTAVMQPDPATLSTAFIVIVLIYFASFSAFLVAFSFIGPFKSDFSRRFSISLASGSVPALLIMASTIWRAQYIEIILLFVTLILVGWYMTYKR